MKVKSSVHIGIVVVNKLMNVKPLLSISGWRS